MEMEGERLVYGRGSEAAGTFILLKSFHMIKKCFFLFSSFYADYGLLNTCTESN